MREMNHAPRTCSPDLAVVNAINAIRTRLISRVIYEHRELVVGKAEPAHGKRSARHDVQREAQPSPIISALSLASNPIVNDPAGTTAISGQFSHSRKASFDFTLRSCLAVRGAALFSAQAGPNAQHGVSHAATTIRKNRTPLSTTMAATRAN
jgi:hypothetical protein